jgi:hypothetical protein
MIEGTPKAIQDSMKFLWALVVCVGCLSTRQFIYIYVGLVLGIRPVEPILGTKKKSELSLLF